MAPLISSLVNSHNQAVQELANHAGSQAESLAQLKDSTEELVDLHKDENSKFATVRTNRALLLMAKALREIARREEGEDIDITDQIAQIEILLEER